MRTIIPILLLADPLLEGSWEGRYIDIGGFEGRLFLELEVEGDAVRGSYRLELADEESVEVLKGELRGEVDGDQVRFTLTFGEREVTWTATFGEALPHALQALRGTVENPPGTRFKGGVFIAWRYAG